MRRASWKIRAVTIFEAVLSTVLVGIVVVGLVYTATESYHGSRKNQARTLAANALLERISFHEGQVTALIGRRQSFAVAGPPWDFRGWVQATALDSPAKAVELTGEIRWIDAKSYPSVLHLQLKKIVALKP